MPDKKLKFRQMLERRIVRRVMSGLLNAGYLIEVYDPEVYNPKIKKPTLHETLKDVVPDLFSCDNEMVYVHERQYRSAVGWVHFIYGNGNNGLDVIHDYSTNLEPQLKPVMDYVDTLQDRFGN
jgi:hypothetical protein